MPLVLQPSAATTHAYLTRVDPRARLLTATAFCVLTALVQTLPAMLVALTAALLACLLSGTPSVTILKRLLPLNLVIFLLLIFLSLTASGPRLPVVGSLTISHEGLLLAFTIALKGNAIVLAMIALLASIEPSVLGHALSHLRVPQKLVLLMLFTIRYLDVLHEEYSRLRAAMRVRAFLPRMNRHTYRAFGHLVGMLLVRSLDRSERILAAMKCRGFTGRFFLLDHFAFTRRDLPFCAASLAVLSLITWMELCLTR